MDKITESLLNLFCQEHGIQSLKEDKQFEHFAAYLMIGREVSRTFDTFDVVVGDEERVKGQPKTPHKGWDTGIDAIAVIVNGLVVTDPDELADIHANSGYLDVEFIFVQAERTTGFQADKIGTFTYGVTDFFRDDPQLVRNEKVSNAALLRHHIYSDYSSSFKRHNPKCKMFYVTTGKVAEDPILDARAETPKRDLEDIMRFAVVEFQRIGAPDIQKIYQRHKNYTSAKFRFVHKVPIDVDIEGVTQALSGYLPWSEFQKIITNDVGVLQRGLFVDNVRDWQEFNPVNTEIKETLESPARNHFALMNNGVTIIAKRIHNPKQSDFELEGYQIVNGCQTSNVLYETRESLDDTVLVPIRLIGTEDEQVTKDIIRATNRQTEVKEDQFFALEDFTKGIEKFFVTYPESHKLYYERRSCQYESASGIERVRVVTFGDLVRTFAAMFLNEPHRTTKNYSGLVKQVGNKIMHKDHRMEPYYAAAFAKYKIEFFWRSERLETKLKPARFHILLAMRILAVGYDMPDIKARKMAKYADALIAVLHDPDKCEPLIIDAAALIRKAAAGNYERDVIRTEDFTEKVLSLAKDKRSDPTSREKVWYHESE